jgi:phosphate transport system substrate-binding protein
MSRAAILAALLIGASALAPSFAAADDSITITAGGSTALLPLVKAAAEEYHKDHANVTVNVQGGGSGVGLAQAQSKGFDIGDSDIPADPKKYPDLADHQVCAVGFAVIVNPGTNVKDLKKSQIVDIFSGKITNWKEVGGADQKITIVNRPRTSGTRAVFVKTVMGTTPVSEAGLTEDATGQVVNIVKQTAGAVSYAALPGVKAAAGQITLLSVDGVAATDDNITAQKYPIWSFEHMYTNGAATGEVSRFLAYVQANSSLIHSQGYILKRDMPKGVQDALSK